MPSFASTERDITQNSRNTLSQPTREVLAKLAGPVKITIFAARQDPRGDLRKMIGDFLAPPLRRELAANLREVLARWRAALNPANTTN